MFIPSSAVGSNVPHTSATSYATSPATFKMFTVSDDVAGILLMFGLLAFYGVALLDRWRQLRATKNERLITGRGLSALRPRIAGRIPSYGAIGAKATRPRSGPSKPTRKVTPKVRATQTGSRLPTPVPRISDTNLLQVPSVTGTPTRI